MRRFLTSFALAAALAALGACLMTAAPAPAAQAPAISDCNANGKLTQHYSVTQLREALSTMGADVKEYTDCYDVIQRELLAQIGSSHGSGGGSHGSGGSFLPTPLIVVLVLLVLGAGGFSVFAARRRGGADGDAGPGSG